MSCHKRARCQFAKSHRLHLRRCCYRGRSGHFRRGARHFIACSNHSGGSARRRRYGCRIRRCRQQFYNADNAVKSLNNLNRCVNNAYNLLPSRTIAFKRRSQTRNTATHVLHASPSIRKFQFTPLQHLLIVLITLNKALHLSPLCSVKRVLRVSKQFLEVANLRLDTLQTNEFQF